MRRRQYFKYKPKGSQFVYRIGYEAAGKTLRNVYACRTGADFAHFIGSVKHERGVWIPAGYGIECKTLRTASIRLLADNAEND